MISISSAFVSVRGRIQRQATTSYFASSLEPQTATVVILLMSSRDKTSLKVIASESWTKHISRGLYFPFGESSNFPSKIILHFQKPKFLCVNLNRTVISCRN